MFYAKSAIQIGEMGPEETMLQVTGTADIVR